MLSNFTRAMAGGACPAFCGKGFAGLLAFSLTMVPALAAAEQPPANAVSPQPTVAPAQDRPAVVPAPEDDAPGSMPSPPADLVVLVDKVGLQGRYRLGVFGRQGDSAQPDVWRLNLWEQKIDRLYISTDVLNCSTKQPMRITGGRQGAGLLILRTLNPGGPITPANRLDHQIWWAACFPEHAGKDPATLAPEARHLGFNGTLLEQEQVVPGSRRP